MTPTTPLRNFSENSSFWCVKSSLRRRQQGFMHFKNFCLKSMKPISSKSFCCVLVKLFDPTAQFVWIYGQFGDQQNGEAYSLANSPSLKVPLPHISSPAFFLPPGSPSLSPLSHYRMPEDLDKGVLSECAQSVLYCSGLHWSFSSDLEWVLRYWWCRTERNLESCGCGPIERLSNVKSSWQM